MSDHYKISIACNRADAEHINVVLENDNQWTDADIIPTITTRELAEFDDSQWMIDIYLSHEPDPSIFADIERLLGRPIDADTVIEKFIDEDWVTLSQAALGSISIGPFHIHSHDESPLDDKINLCISAGQAFGTGHHHTTAGCLAAIDALHKSDHNFSNIADIGTGTGLLAFAAHRLWPNSQIIASDSDPVAVKFAMDAATDNNISIGSNAGEILMLCASGTDDAAIESREPYDLVIANILAGPLIELAPAFYQIMDKDAILILAGLLDSQIDRIIAAYDMMEHISSDHNNGWPVVMFKKQDIYEYKADSRSSGRTSQAEGDYGEW